MNRFGYRLICRCGMLLFVFILFSCTGTDRTIAGAERGDSSERTGTVGDGSTQDSTGIEKYRNLWPYVGAMPKNHWRVTMKNEIEKIAQKGNEE